MPILSLILGSEQKARDAARSLRSEGVYGLVIRPPTVPRGRRLHRTLSSDHTDENAAQLIQAVGRISKTA